LRPALQKLHEQARHRGGHNRSGQADAATGAAPKVEPAKSMRNARFVVQVGAYGEAASARDMRQVSTNWA